MVFAAAGLIIFLRRSDNWVTILSSVALIVQGVCLTRPEDSFAAAPPEWRLFGIVVTCLATIASITALVVIPDGRFVPSYSRFTVAFWAICGVARYFFLPQFA